MTNPALKITAEEDKKGIQLIKGEWETYSFAIELLLAGKGLLHCIEPDAAKAPTSAQSAQALGLIVSTLTLNQLKLTCHARDSLLFWDNLKKSQTQPQPQQTVASLRNITSCIQSNDQPIQEYAQPIIDSLRELKKLCQTKSVDQVLELVACTSFLRGIDKSLMHLLRQQFQMRIPKA